VRAKETHRLEVCEHKLRPPPIRSHQEANLWTSQHIWCGLHIPLRSSVLTYVEASDFIESSRQKISLRALQFYSTEPYWSF
jgi:hypothetical protein